jgi:hypothetical protein
MPELTKFGFIVKGPGYQHGVHRAVLDSGRFATWVVGVSCVVDATAVVAELAGLGVQLIELCGGFTHEERELLQGGCDIPIGRVTYDAAEEARLSELFAPPSGH